MAKYTTLKSLFVAIADAIRGKDGSTSEIAADSFPDRISAIQTEDHTMEDAIIDGTIVSYDNDRIKKIAPYKFYGTIYLTEVNIPAVKEIGVSAFADCMKLQRVMAPETTIIDIAAFAGCAALEEITCTNATNIAARAFIGCAKLKSIDILGIADGIQATIWGNVFLGCDSLTAVIIRNTGGVIIIDDDAFAGSAIAGGTCYIYVPRALVDSYKTAKNWSAYASQIRALEDYTVDGTATGDLDDRKI